MRATIVPEMRQVMRSPMVALALGLLLLSAPAASQQPDRTRASSPKATAGASSSIPSRLTDEQFWRLSTDLSEPSGYFRSENLVSNEHTFQFVIPALKTQTRPGGVYLGVAPDQNFTYILATQPRIAFIVDIRRGNLLQHLMYKGLVELSNDRAEFVSRLFSKKRPAGVTAKSTVLELFTAFVPVASDPDLYRDNVAALREHLLYTRKFPLSVADMEQLESIYFAFFWDGPGIRYSTSPGFGGRGPGGSFPSYEELMMQADWDGTARGYLATEAHFRALKSMQERNLIVPVVGNFAGPKALRSIGRWARERGAIISTFYVSNVEQYLFQDLLFDLWARNVATLPVDDTSTFVRSVSSRFGFSGRYLGPDGRASALDPIRGFVRAFEGGLLQTYGDVNARSR